MHTQILTNPTPNIPTTRVRTTDTSSVSTLRRLRVTLTTLFSLLPLILSPALPAQSFTTPGNERGNESRNTIAGAIEPTTLPQLFASTTLDRNEIYVGEQLNVTMEILSPASAFNIRKQKMDIAAADVFTLEKHAVDTTRDSIPYRLETIRYAIYFKEPGVFTVPALKVTATLPVSAGGANADSNPKISVQSAEQVVSVSQAPVPASQWLPASGLTVETSWTSKGEALQFVAGQPVSRQYVFTVTGQFPTAIPAPEFTFPSGIRHYPNAPQFEKHNDKSGVRGSLVQAINLIPERAGEYTLPALAIKWWNTKTRRWQTETVAEESIVVHPGQPADSDKSQNRYRTLVGVLATLSFALTCLCFYLWRQLRRTRRAPAPVATEKHAWNALDRALKSKSALTSKRALSSKDALEIRRALTTWHAAANPSTNANRIDQVATNDAGISASLQRLEALLFRHTKDKHSDNHKDQKPNFQQLRKQLKSYRQSLIAKTRMQSGNAAVTDSAERLSLYPPRLAD